MWSLGSCLDLLGGEKIGKERGCNGGLCSKLLGINERERERRITLEEWEGIRTRRGFGAEGMGASPCRRSRML